MHDPLPMPRSIPAPDCAEHWAIGPASSKSCIPRRSRARCFGGCAHLPHCVFFDSAQSDPHVGRYSFVAADPFDWLVAAPDDAAAWDATCAAIESLDRSHAARPAAVSRRRGRVVLVRSCRAAWNDCRHRGSMSFKCLVLRSGCTTWLWHLIMWRARVDHLAGFSGAGANTAASSSKSIGRHSFGG